MESFLNTIKVPWNHIFFSANKVGETTTISVERVSETQDFLFPVRA